MDHLKTFFGAGCMAAALLIAGTALAQTSDDISQDRQELKQERQQIHSDRMERRQDRNELGGEFRTLRRDRRDLVGDLKNSPEAD